MVTITNNPGKGASVFNSPGAADGLRRLAQAVIIQASLEAKAGDVEAKDFLVDPETSDSWLAVADVDPRAIRRWVYRGCKRLRYKKE
jgi:hypothetical protein